MSGAVPTVEQLNRRVRLKLWADVPSGAFGLNQTFDSGLPLWSKVEPVHGLAIRAGMNTDEVPTHLFWVRYREATKPANISRSHVIEWNSRRYRVLDAINVGDRQRFTRITAKDIGPT